MEFVKVSDAISWINKQRLANKDRWICVKVSVSGNNFAIKSYNTWIQRIEYGPYIDSGPIDCTVREYKEFLKSIMTGV